MCEASVPGPFMPYAPACQAKTCSSWMVSSQECDEATNPIGPCCVPTFSTVLNQCCLCPHGVPLPLDPPRCKVPCFKKPDLDNDPNKVQTIMVGSEEVEVIQLPYIKPKPTLIYPYFYECPYACSCCSPYECNQFCKIDGETIDSLENSPPACCMEVNCAPGFKVKPLPFKLPFGCINLPRKMELANCEKKEEIIKSLEAGNGEEMARIEDMDLFESMVALPPKTMPDVRGISFRENTNSPKKSSVKSAMKASLKSSNKSENNRGRSDESLSTVAYAPKSLLFSNNNNRPFSSFEFYKNDILDDKKKKNGSKNNNNNNNNINYSKMMNRSNNSIGSYKDMPICVANTVNYDPRCFSFNGMKRKHPMLANKPLSAFKAVFDAGSARLQQQWQRHKEQKILNEDETKQEIKNKVQNKNEIFKNDQPVCSQNLEQVASEEADYYGFAPEEQQMEKCCVQQETPQPCILQQENFQSKSFTDTPFVDVGKTQIHCNTEISCLPPQADEMKKKMAEKTFETCPLQPYKNWQEEQKKLCANYEKIEKNNKEQNYQVQQPNPTTEISQKQAQKNINRSYNTMEEHYAQLRKKQIEFMEKSSRPNNCDVTKEKEMCLVHSSFSSNVDLRNLTNAQRKSIFNKRAIPQMKSCQLLHFENHSDNNIWFPQKDQQNVSCNNKYNYTQTYMQNDSYEAKFNGCNVPENTPKMKFNQLPQHSNINASALANKKDAMPTQPMVCCPPSPTVPQNFPGDQYKSLPEKYINEANEDMCCCCNTYAPVTNNMVVRQRVLRFVQKERKFCNSRKLSNHLGCFDRPIRNTVAFECELELDDDDPCK